MADASGSTETTLSKPKERPSSVHIESAWTERVSTWTVAEVRAALCQHEDGCFRVSAALADHVMRDPVIAGDINTRCRALAAKCDPNFKVEAGLGDGRKRETARKRCEDLWWETCQETTIFAIHKDAVLIGAAVGRVWWDRRLTEWRPRLVHLPAHGLEFEAWSRRWMYTTRDGQRLEVTPGDGTWFLHTPYGDRSWMGGAIRQVAIPFLMRDFDRNDWARFNERNGMPVLAVYEPPTATDDVEGTAGAESAETKAYYRGLRARMSRDAVMRLPTGRTKDELGWDAKWLELQGKGFETFGAQLDKLASEIHLALLGRDPGAGAKGGDGELASEKLRGEYLAADAETLSTSLRDCVWKPDAKYNLDATDLDVAAWGRWNTRPPPDLAARATTLKTVGEAMTLLAPIGVDCIPLAEEFGLKATKIEVPKPPPAPPQAPAPPPE